MDNLADTKSQVEALMARCTQLRRELSDSAPEASAALDEVRAKLNRLRAATLDEEERHQNRRKRLDEQKTLMARIGDLKARLDRFAN